MNQPPEFDLAAIRERIEQAARDAGELSPDVARDVAFHMTDWLADLAAYMAFCRDPQSLDAERLHELLLDFLSHVPNHVAAAGKLVADTQVRDIFGVGAVAKD